MEREIILCICARAHFLCLWLDSVSCSVEGAGAGVRLPRMRDGRGWRTEDRRSRCHWEETSLELIAQEGGGTYGLAWRCSLYWLDSSHMVALMVWCRGSEGLGLALALTCSDTLFLKLSCLICDWGSGQCWLSLGFDKDQMLCISWESLWAIWAWGWRGLSEGTDFRESCAATLCHTMSPQASWLTLIVQLTYVQNWGGV